MAPLSAVICEDDRVTRQMLRSLVEGAGYSVLAGVDNAMDALKLVVAHRPDVLVLDLVLPGVPGEEIIESIGEVCPTKVIVYSSFDPRRAVKCGARLFVAKGQVTQLEAMLLRIAKETQASI